MNTLSVRPIRTRIFKQGEDLAAFVIEQVDRSLVHEEMVLVVTSKVVSLAEGRLVSTESTDKSTLAKAEADVYLGKAAYGFDLTIKHGVLIPSAGIDESNSEGNHFILFPLDPFDSARRLGEALREHWSIAKLGIVITDSHTTPLRRGVTGISISHWGFRALRNLEGTRDLFGRELRVTSMNLADGISAAAVMMMGEGSESMPLALVSGVTLDYNSGGQPSELRIAPEDDLYAPLFEGRLT